MIFYDLKMFLQGYVEYLSFTYGVEFKLQRDKKLNEFEISARVVSNNDVSNYKKVIDIETGDIRNKCIVRISSIDPRIIGMVKGRFEYKSTYYGYSGLSIHVTINNQEELQKLFNILEEIEFFNKWR